MSKIELGISSGPEDEILELRAQDKEGVPVNFYLKTGAESPDNPLFAALGCLGCDRLKKEGEVRLSRSLTPETTLIHPETFHPGISQRLRGEKGFTIYCPLLNQRNTHPSLRKKSPPCKKKEGVSVNY